MLVIDRFRPGQTGLGLINFLTHVIDIVRIIDLFGIGLPLLAGQTLRIIGIYINMIHNPVQFRAVIQIPGQFGITQYFMRSTVVTVAISIKIRGTEHITRLTGLICATLQHHIGTAFMLTTS